jgi:hypothetical protein
LRPQWSWLTASDIVLHKEAKIMFLGGRGAKGGKLKKWLQKPATANCGTGK